ncbi:amidohydrolase family protein [Nocardia sp. NBC_01730]|uniref:amidohydrolase family protein n=1 Tax=Nocardia sp. NBC_01730 TaxID=2975998 RepID=UPI002E12EC97|nr:amidohydrolase family protein [Nocardia sp. NBC_01730]
MLIRRARIFGAEHTEVRLTGGRITGCGTALRPLPGEDDIDACGGWLLPGLHDHHVHLSALAATADSVRVGPPQVRTITDLATGLHRADAESPEGAWIRGVGYHESVAGELDRRALDRILGHRPVRIQHRSGALWMLNSRACAAVDLQHCPLPGVERDATGSPTGRRWRLDAWLGPRIGAPPVDLTQLGARAAALGVTGFTDATPALRQSDIDDLAESAADGRIRQRVHCMAPSDIADPRIARFSLGPTKILLDDTALPDLDEFTDRIRALHETGRPVAVHCVTRVQLILIMAALDAAGAHEGDRIEHGAIIPAESMAWLREHDVTVITQPHFLVERAEQYDRDVPAGDQPDLWRLGSLIRARVGVAAGTDAPFGGADPWAVIRAAVRRPATSSISEGISLRSALSLFFGPPERPAADRCIAPGEIADLTLLSAPPEEVAATWQNPLVAATIVDGSPVYLAD